MKNKKENIIIVNAVKCPKCGDEIYSVYRHDFQTCKCGFVSIDGGNDYTTINCNTKEKLNIYKKEITKKEYLKKIKK